MTDIRGPPEMLLAARSLEASWLEHIYLHPHLTPGHPELKARVLDAVLSPNAPLITPGCLEGALLFLGMEAAYFLELPE